LISSCRADFNLSTVLTFLRDEKNKPAKQRVCCLSGKQSAFHAHRNPPTRKVSATTNDELISVLFSACSCFAMPFLEFFELLQTLFIVRPLFHRVPREVAYTT